jgi:hypothetical protein
MDASHQLNLTLALRQQIKVAQPHKHQQQEFKERKVKQLQKNQPWFCNYSPPFSLH